MENSNNSEQTQIIEAVKFSPLRVYGAFLLGLSTAVAVRALLVLSHIEPGWVRPVWYFAVIGNVFFFLYRYQISDRRKKAIRKHHLIEKVSQGRQLDKKDREVLVYLLSSIKKSPEHWNYLIIFAFSVLAIGIDLAFVFGLFG